MRIHIVQKGDTLWKLAQKYGVDFEALKAANNQLSNPDLIMPGMKIKIPTNSIQPSKKEGYKEAPVKEMPKKEQTPPPSIKEEKEAPLPMPAPPQPAPSYHLQKTDMNFNIYKQQQAITAPPKMPKPKEAPLVKEKPVEKQPEFKKAPVEPKKVKPTTKPLPMKQQMPEDCYPVAPFMPCPPPCPPHGYHQGNPYGYGSMYQGVPAQGYQQHYGHPGMMPAAPGPAPHSVGMESNKVTGKEQWHSHGKDEQKQHQDTPNFGDVTANEYQNFSQNPYYPTGAVPAPHAGYGVPHFQGYGTYPYPYNNQPSSYGTWREQEEDEEN
ncbi:SafA/ExsA family spore coat assembly protein [Bacillus tamaricis]|uniref:SafA/ExsA family spore coat assembly protein n=1 Tax=Evansella tamaricis TaxID=2069301 RepID=A0ABS6JK14_9BACI|nr:SafA/ExsA family spore coat assembly protein [Evansella tamaricis]